MPDKESTQPELQPIDSSESAGAILSRTRKSYEISVEEVARSLNLGMDAIRALESNQYDQLPGSTFVKGYIRSYANLLDLDAEEVLSRVNIAPEKPSEIPASRTTVKYRQKPQKKRSRGKRGGVFFKSLVIIILLAGLVLFGLNQVSTMDREKVADFLKLPAPKDSGNQSGDENEIVFPDTEPTDGQKKQALIPIE